jgi:hypothetical protein
MTVLTTEELFAVLARCERVIGMSTGPWAENPGPLLNTLAAILADRDKYILCHKEPVAVVYRGVSKPKIKGRLGIRCARPDNLSRLNEGDLLYAPLNKGERTNDLLHYSQPHPQTRTL